MSNNKQKCFYPKPESVTKNWVLIDANDKVLGRLASKASKLLRGKDQADYTPSVDNGNFVIIINSEKIKVTGNKAKQKNYYSHSKYPGGLRTVTYAEQMKKDPTQIIRTAVKGMLPKNRLQAKMLNSLKIYIGENHPHEAQKPTVVEL
jgi:large subunit ribosomal protein L13